MALRIFHFSVPPREDRSSKEEFPVSRFDNSILLKVVKELNAFFLGKDKFLRFLFLFYLLFTLARFALPIYILK